MLTGTVLGLLLAATYVLANEQLLTANNAMYQSSLDTIAERLQYENAVRDLWLAELETQLHGIIHIEEMSVPLHFMGAWTPRTPRGSLIAQAKETAEKMGVGLSGAPSSSLHIRQIDFEMTGEAGEKYRVFVARIPKSIGWFNLILILELAGVNAQRWQLVTLYGGLFAAGLLGLWLVNWILAGRAIRPTAEAIRQQSDFVAAASHELRGPLAVISASLYAAKKDPHQGARFLEAAERETARLTRLVNDLFMLAGSDAKAWSLLTQPVELDTLCIEVYEQQRLLAAQKGHELMLVLPEEALPVIAADRERLVQLLVILLSNAMDYAPAGTAIELITQAHGSRSVRFSVVDHGPGVPDEDKKRVFERFYRLDKSRTDKAHFGLGLSVANELASLHGGTLSLADTPGGGSTFTLTLPLNAG